MKKIEMSGKKVLVLGLAKSGFYAATLLHDLGATVTVNDRQSTDGNELVPLLEKKGIQVVGGGHPLSLLDGTQLIVKNPGIPYKNDLLQEAIKRNIPIVTEIELTHLISEAPIIGITGSNGKTTTTTLIYEMMIASELKAQLAGNIGTVSCEVARHVKEDEWLVLELSSFQLQGTETFQPHISLILNLFDAHLDYHGNFEEYRTAKFKLLENQQQTDFAVLNKDDARVMELSHTGNAQKYFFSRMEKTNGAYIQDEAVYFGDEKVIDVQHIVLPGQHNLENILAAITVVKLAGGTNEGIAHVLKTFSGVKHRLQFVRTVNDRKFYNDSKATNILATEKALSSFTAPTILLAGGLDRGNEFDELAPHMKHVKHLVTFGETAHKFVSLAEKIGLASVQIVDNVDVAVRAAYEHSESGDVILLSPACASWDQYPSFEVRGDIFIQAVNTLK